MSDKVYPEDQFQELQEGPASEVPQSETSEVDPQLQIYRQPPKQFNNERKYDRPKQKGHSKWIKILLVVEFIAILVLLSLLVAGRPVDSTNPQVNQPVKIPLTRKTENKQVTQIDLSTQEQSGKKTQSPVYTTNSTSQNSSQPKPSNTLQSKPKEQPKPAEPVKYTKPVQSIQPIKPGSPKVQAKWPSSSTDYDMSENFNLWDISKQEKIQLLRKYRQLPQDSKPKPNDNYQQINYGHDPQYDSLIKDFQATTEVIDWASLQLTPEDQKAMEEKHEIELAKRNVRFLEFKNRYRKMYLGKEGFINPKKRITYQQFLDNLDYYQFPGRNLVNDPQLSKLHKREKSYHEQKYKLNETKTELPACMVAPTHNNEIAYRYAWHLDSIIQQQYSNYKLIIIDDFSKDKTTELIARHLKWRNFPKDKVVLIRNKKHRNALQNTQYALRKYCDYGQIFYVVDGDDELHGTQALRLFNTIYQKQKLYFLYSNFFSWDTGLPQPLVIGLPQDYPLQVKQRGNYRTAYHAYSQLRTSLTDIFLLTPARSLKDAKGAYYWTIGDNAMVFPALEMSCGRLQYIPEFLYWYTANTGVNDWRTSKQKEYMLVKNHIANIQKHFHCINHIFQMMQTAVNAT